MNKILLVANIHKHFRAFHIPYIEYLKSIGCEVHVAANDSDTKIPEADKQYNLPINRNPFSVDNIKAVYELSKIIEKGGYRLLHCHTAMGSVVARLAARKFRKDLNLKVLYTAHGFHFFKGSSKLYWMLYYPMEKYLSGFTDGIITINEEDFSLVTEKKFSTKYIFKVPGVGINTQKFSGFSFDEKDLIRKIKGYRSDTFIIIYIAEFIERKNHKFLLESIFSLKERIEDFKFLFAGRGVLREEIEVYAEKLMVSDKVDFLGFRADIGELIIMSDIGVSVSKQEGLPMNVAEEMYSGKPVVASKIRGHIDLIDDGKNGFLFEIGNQKEFVEKIFRLYSDKELYRKISVNAKRKVTEFELPNCMEHMKNIYSEFLKK